LSEGSFAIEVEDFLFELDVVFEFDELLLEFLEGEMFGKLLGFILELELYSISLFSIELIFAPSFEAFYYETISVAKISFPRHPLIRFLEIILNKEFYFGEDMISPGVEAFFVKSFLEEKLGGVFIQSGGLVAVYNILPSIEEKLDIAQALMSYEASGLARELSDLVVEFQPLTEISY
jgi:hypothetical protein